MSCDYCDEQKGIKTVYHEIYGGISRIVFKTKNFIVFPCLGQLREGHLLIASKAHINAIGMLPDDLMQEIDALILQIGQFFREVYHQEVLCFEHGVLGDEGANGGCGIYHLHLHLLPATHKEFSTVLDHVKNHNANQLFKAQEIMDTRRCVALQNTYVFLAYGNEGGLQESYLITNADNYFVSQYMRRIVSEILGKLDWNWRDNQHIETTFLRTLEKSKTFFAKSSELQKYEISEESKEGFPMLVHS